MRVRRGRFPLLEKDTAPPARSPLQLLRVAWRKDAASCRRFEAAARAALRERPGLFGPATEALFDLVSESELLCVVMPAGRVPRDFASRCLSEARKRRVALRAEREAFRSTRVGPRTVERLARIAARYPGQPEEGLRPGELAIPGTALVVHRRGKTRERELVPGSRILLGPPLVRGSRRLRVGSGRQPLAARRLGSALAMIDAAWHEAAAEVRARTRLVLTLDEPGLVSYSHAHRPGVSYLNLRGKRMLDLADDLLHETAHHRLHAIEEITPLFLPVGSEEEARYWSPWRRAPRPVRGIYHAAYTFAFRAELFRRVVQKARECGGKVGPLRLDERRARRLEEEIRAEARRIRRSVRDLTDAARRGLLTAAGERLLLRTRRVARRSPG